MEEVINTPQGFLDYIRSTKFDYNSVQVWEKETLMPYLDPEKLNKEQPNDTT